MKENTNLGYDFDYKRFFDVFEKLIYIKHTNGGSFSRPMFSPLHTTSISTSSTNPFYLLKWGGKLFHK